MTVESIFNEARAIDDEAARRAFLERACGADAESRRLVEELLAANAATGVLDRPPEKARPAGYDERGRAGEIIGGKYTLIEIIGEGGMGVVWRAEQKEPVRRHVALKVIKAGMDSRSVVARFEVERQALAKMDHPNIARVLDAGATADNRPFFVMELVKGVPITRFCDERQCSPKQRLELFIPVCLAIQHAHLKGIIHRDIKPSNVLVALYDDHPVPKVIDFGVAKAIGGDVTQETLHTKFGAVVGTPEYMSPEQAQLNELDVDTRSDVYLLGVLLYELLTGTTPHDPQSLGRRAVLEILRIIREEDPPSPSNRISTTEKLASIAACRATEPKRLAGLVKGDLDWIVMKCLEKDRVRRYETANALASDVQRYLADEPVAAGPPGALYRLRKFARRRKLAMAFAATVALSLALTLGALALGIRAANAARDREAVAREAADQGRIAALDAKTAEERARVEALKSLRAAQMEKTAKEATLVRSEGLRLAAESNAVRAGDPSLALLLGLEAVERYRHHLTFSSLYDAARIERERAALDIPNFSGASLLKWSPDGNRLLSAGTSNGGTGVAATWDGRDRRNLVAWRGPLLHVNDAAWSPDGSRIVTVHDGYAQLRFTDGKLPARAFLTDRIAYVWDSATGRVRFTLRGHADRLVSVRFSPDGATILTASFDRTARLWDANTGKERAVLGGHDRSLSIAEFSPDGARLFTVEGSNASTSHTADMVKKLPQDVAVDPDDLERPFSVESTGSGGWSGSISSPVNRYCTIWDAKSGKRQATAESSGLGSLFSRFAAPVVAIYSPDGKRLLLGLGDGVIRAVDAEKGTLLESLAPAIDSRVTALVAGPNGKYAAGRDSGAIVVWEGDGRTP
ncbi:MAG TPA: protein kinase [Planctomycetia bacterium]|nr:protein kinase [Planctomycetia bacterium]